MSSHIPPPAPPAYTMALETDLPPQSAFPQNLPPRPVPASGTQTWKQRNCPHMRSCWHFSFQSYNPRHSPDKATLWRRIAMISIVVVRLLMSIEALWALWEGLVSLVLYCIIAVVGIWFIMWCLAVIGDAAGERRVFGKLIGRRHLDAFLYGTALVHAVIAGVWPFVGSLGAGVTWLAMGLLIAVVAWICSWTPECPPSNV